MEENALDVWLGLLACLDCMHYEWKNCPYAWKGVYTGKEKTPTIVLEAACDKNLKIWHFNFGTAGSCNDQKVLSNLSILYGILKGTSPEVNWKLSGHAFKWPYFLTDEIYPPWAGLYKQLQLHKLKSFHILQSAKKIDVKILRDALVFFCLALR